MKKKTTRDVIRPGVRYTEALRVIRTEHPDVTIILPSEKIQVRPGSNVRQLIQGHVSLIKQSLDNDIAQWRGESAESHIAQVRRLLQQYFHFHPDAISLIKLEEMIDEMIHLFNTEEATFY